MLKIDKYLLTVAILVNTLLSPAHAQNLLSNARLTAKERLGKSIFFDTNLSSPPGQSCASCHDAAAAFADPDRRFPTSKGVISGRFGNRNTPSIMYAPYSPPFHFDHDEGLYIGGQFLDGRAATLKKQAGQPLLNPVEMANADEEEVIGKIRASAYAGLFERVYGAGALDHPRKAFRQATGAVKTFERSRAFKRFTSKYDRFLAGKAKLTRQEMNGRKVFEDPERGNCAACHPSRPAKDGTPPLFTDFSYDNLGVPRNPDNPFYELSPEFNVKGRGFVDRGLGGFVGDPAEDGKLKVPTLRNIAITGPYMHNGYFKTLRGVVEFYSTRDVKSPCPKRWTSEAQALQNQCWPDAEVPENVNRDELGDLGLTAEEIDDVVAFLKTLTDGYRPGKQ